MSAPPDATTADGDGSSRQQQPGSRRRPHAFSNGVSAKHLLMLVVFMAVRNSGGIMSALAASTGGGSEAGHDGPAHRSGEEATEEGHAHEGYQVFHVEFERVQLPFIISLWIFVSSLAKIGECVKCVSRDSEHALISHASKCV